MRVAYRTWDPEDRTRPHWPMVGKIVLHPETPEELAELDAFRKHVGRHDRRPHGGRGDRFEIVFYLKRIGRRDSADGQEPAAGAAAAAPIDGGKGEGQP